MSDVVLEASALRKQFRDTEVLAGVDLRLQRGQVTGLLGLNGAGKSTLIRCLLGLLRPTGGSARIFGCESWNLGESEKARLGYVPQEVWLFPTLTVRGMADYTGAFYANWDAAAVTELLRKWELPQDKACGVLSAGERQKLGIVLALGHQPELLVLDEPVASLDPAARRAFLESLLELAADGNRTVLFSTHITSDVERVCSHVALLGSGRIQFHEEQDGLKERTKRLRLAAGTTLPSKADLPGVLQWQTAGTTGVMTVNNFTAALPDELRSKWGADVVVEDLNLEEIFLACR
ncbi:MAG: transporter ATP-binding protein YtrB [Planctomycetota bacterium]|jgi:ABC-2 type transport system ATP-binding protein